MYLEVGAARWQGRRSVFVSREAALAASPTTIMSDCPPQYRPESPLHHRVIFDDEQADRWRAARGAVLRFLGTRECRRYHEGSANQPRHASTHTFVPIPGKLSTAAHKRRRHFLHGLTPKFPDRSFSNPKFPGGESSCPIHSGASLHQSWYTSAA